MTSLFATCGGRPSLAAQTGGNLDCAFSSFVRSSRKALTESAFRFGNQPAAVSDRHVLFPERDQFTFHPGLIFTEIERQRPDLPLLEKIDEIWHVETVFYRQARSVRFELRNGEQMLATISFRNGELVLHSEDRVPYPV